MLLCAADVDAIDPRARITRAERLGKQHAGQVQVSDELAGAEHFFSGVGADEAAVDARAIRRGGNGQILAEEFSRKQDCFFDFNIARTAADIAANRGLDLLTRGAQGFIQQRLSADDHAWDAEAALYRACLAKTIGIDFFFTRGESLNRQDGFPRKAG
ncbi:hypothetical protein SDC9_206908 [bioreactor metagenome]|uniref:Uncharacterized protein n=1 Tax=bioreactor metagenome TaxID=1076179 RepID=A0A645J6A9_9ZZZZ